MSNAIEYTSYRSTKKKLLKAVKPLYYREFQLLINHIVADIRGEDYQQIKRVNYLRSDEVIAFLKEIGEPLDKHGKQVVFPKGRVGKRELLRKIPALDVPTFRSVSAKVVGFYRELDQNQARYMRWLRSNEVMAFLKELGEPVN